MAFRDSPGITTIEQDRSLFVEPGQGTVIGMVVDSTKGRVGQTSSDSGLFELNIKDDWRKYYSDPTTDLEKTANVILEASDGMDSPVRLLVKRALPRDSNSDIDALWSGIKLDTSTSPEQLTALSTGEVYPVESYSLGADEKFALFANNPGAHGDNIGIEINNDVGESDEFRVNVYTRPDSTGSFTQQESHFVSQNSKLDGRNRQMFIEDRINADSDLILAVNNSNDNGDLTETSYGTTAMGGGSDGSPIEKSDLVDAAQAFRNEDIELTALVHGGQASLNDTTYANELFDIAASRQDSIALLDAPYDTDVSDVTSTYLSTLARPSGTLPNTYGYVYYGWHNDRESITNKNVQNPPSAYAAEALAISRDQNLPWSPPAGQRRGLVSSKGLVRDSLTRSERDELYRNHVNYFRTKSGLGTFLDGTKNLRNIEAGTKTDRLNVRLLLNYIKTNVKDFLGPFIHDLNTPSTRREIRTGLRSFLSTVEGQGGLNDSQVVCDESNNPQPVIDSHELVIDLKLDPTVTIEFVKVNVQVFETGGIELAESIGG